MALNLGHITQEGSTFTCRQLDWTLIFSLARHVASYITPLMCSQLILNWWKYVFYTVNVGAGFNGTFIIIETVRRTDQSAQNNLLCGSRHMVCGTICNGGYAGILLRSRKLCEWFLMMAHANVRGKIFYKTTPALTNHTHFCIITIAMASVHFANTIVIFHTDIGKLFIARMMMIYTSYWSTHWHNIM